MSIISVLIPEPPSRADGDPSRRHTTSPVGGTRRRHTSTLCGINSLTILYWEDLTLKAVHYYVAHVIRLGVRYIFSDFSDVVARVQMQACR